MPRGGCRTVLPGLVPTKLKFTLSGRFLNVISRGSPLLGAKRRFGDAKIYGQRALGAKAPARFSRIYRDQKGGWYFFTTGGRHSSRKCALFWRNLPVFAFILTASGTPCFAAERPRKQIWSEPPCCTAVFVLRNNSSCGTRGFGFDR